MLRRFRVSDHAHAQRIALNIPLQLIELLVQPQLRGASRLLTQNDLLRHASRQLSELAHCVGVYVTSDGQGCVTGVYRQNPRREPLALQQAPLAERRPA